MPIVSVWAFQLDGIFIGATRGRDLRNSMLIAFLGYLALAVLLERAFGNHGLWCALAGFMILRTITLALRLPRIEKLFATPASLVA
jgi:MATE family multidrug resistance protein